MTTISAIRTDNSNGYPIQYQKAIDNQKKAAMHLEKAAKHHLKAAKHHQNGEHEMAAMQVIAAQGHVNIAIAVQQEYSKRFALNSIGSL